MAGVTKIHNGTAWVPTFVGAQGPEGPQGDPGPVVPLGDLTDVDTAGAASGDALSFDGTGWVASGAYVTPDDIAPLPTGGATGDLFIVRQTASGFEYVEITEDPA